MRIKRPNTLAGNLIFVVAVLSYSTIAQPPSSKFLNERFVIKTMAYLVAAEATYSASSGTGTYGTLHQLRIAGLIDDAAAGGRKYGYDFTLTVNGGSPSTFQVTAAPAIYRKTGLHSFFIDQTGILRGGDHNGATATVNDPYIDSCAFWGISDNERCSIAEMRTLVSAENTYSATIGNGQYSFLDGLSLNGLISTVLASGAIHGYNFAVTISTNPPHFQITATPIRYGVTGVRSFYVDESGILRGADHHGLPATDADPSIDN